MEESFNARSLDTIEYMNGQEQSRENADDIRLLYLFVKLNK